MGGTDPGWGRRKMLGEDRGWVDAETKWRQRLGGGRGWVETDAWAGRGWLETEVCRRQKLDGEETG